MRKDIGRIDDLNQEELAALIIDMFHRIIVLHGFWLSEVEHQMGFPKALEIMKEVFRKSYDIQMKRLSKIFGFEMINGVPSPLLNMSRESLLNLMDNIAVNWLAHDGVWFQAVEFNEGMFDAKRCNDSCWTRFSPFEAWSIKQFLKLQEPSGLTGLKKALQFRLYARINIQSIIDESSTGIIFQMNNCRVQSARKQKGLDDYPCKSGGLVEYATFAQTIDSRIHTECIACPPDPHPEGWWCAWRFTLRE